jgi:pSer/pThr/pTyr-binding forkhead associated (FHA) protein
MLHLVALRLEVMALDGPEGRSFRYDFDADRSQITLGRRGGVDVLLPHAQVSLVHARIERKADEWFLVDDGSTNGTRLNAGLVPSGQRALLHDGDRIAIGEFTVLVGIVDAAPDGSTESASSVARRMVREVLERLGPGETQPSLLTLDGPQAGVALTLSDAGRAYVLGRDDKSDLRLDDVDMWQEHAALVRDDHGVSVRDVGATPRLTVNGQPVEGERLLRDGDVLVLGSTALRYADPAEVYLRKLETTPNPGDTAQTELPARASSVTVGRRPELLLLAFGVLAALAAAGALLYVLLS